MATKRFLNPSFLDGSKKSRSFLDTLSGNVSNVCFPSIKTTIFRGLSAGWISEEKIHSLAAPF
ncbi:hypothetical protein IEQ34_013707 [Dendrobium chrysotoxum]|uniref:Uncharacterized protein n=1 Tax=Dendrobium chrysotoxum TaxID=161865 RepID=A0AAV7GQM0_DENCH|nr:hypothetical protein IEQ34_013707 [Dendrobium chrysotoxum]